MSLRIRLTLLLTATLAAALGAVFVLTYRGTGNDVLRQIDQDLRQDSSSLDAQGISIDVNTPREVEQAVRNYVDAQPSFGNLARLYIIKVHRGPVITNEPELVGLAKPLEGRLTKSQARRMHRDAQGLLHAPRGYSTHATREAGSIRLLVVAPAARQQDRRHGGDRRAAGRGRRAPRRAWRGPSCSPARSPS